MQNFVTVGVRGDKSLVSNSTTRKRVDTSRQQCEGGAGECWRAGVELGMIGDSRLKDSVNCVGKWRSTAKATANRSRPT